MKQSKLTTKDYWQNYYGKNYADAKRIVSVCSYYDKFWDLLIEGPNEKKTIIEIGGYPGRYLAYLSNKYRIKPVCLDYNSDISQIEKTFRVMNVENFEILQKDFTIYQNTKKYDYVMSNGFIEHFQNYDKILDKHLEFMKTGSKLLIMIPNMRGYIRFYKYLLDCQNMKIHNLNTMRLAVFKNFAKRHNLKTIHLNYFGGFPLGIHQKHNFFQKVLHKMHWLFFKKIGNRWIEKNPSKFFSSSIVGIFEMD